MIVYSSKVQKTMIKITEKEEKTSSTSNLNTRRFVSAMEFDN